MVAIKPNRITGEANKGRKRTEVKIRKARDVILRRSSSVAVVSSAGQSSLPEDEKGSKQSVAAKIAESSATIVSTVGQSSPLEETVDEQQDSFHVSVNMNTRGEPFIRQVVFSDRPPSAINRSGGKSQGKHIVAYALVEAAIRGQLEGAQLFPRMKIRGGRFRPVENADNSAIVRLENLLEAMDVVNTFDTLRFGRETELLNKEQIGLKIKELRTIRDQIISDQETIFQENSNDAEKLEKLKRAVRSRLSTLRQKINNIIEDMIRRWNKRKDVVYDFNPILAKDPSKPQSGLRSVDVYGSDLDGRENSSRRIFENIALQSNITLDSLEISNTSEDGVDKTLQQFKESSDKKVIGKNLSRLIDIKPIEEFTEDSLMAQYPNFQFTLDFEKMKKEHNRIFILATKEASALGKLAYPKLAGKIDQQEIINNMKDAVIDDLEAAIGRGITNRNYQARLDILKS